MKVTFRLLSTTFGFGFGFGFLIFLCCEDVDFLKMLGFAALSFWSLICCSQFFIISGRLRLLIIKKKQVRRIKQMNVRPKLPIYGFNYFLLVQFICVQVWINFRY